MIRVLLADDSGFMRLALRRMVEAEADFRVIGEAVDGNEAVEAVKRLRPDVVAMDVEMPGLDGIQATARIMALPNPPAVIMVSHHTSDGTAAALAALAAGAVDYVWKSSPAGGLDLGQIERILRRTIRHWAGLRQALPPVLPAEDAAGPGRPSRLRASLAAAGGCDLVVVGASTGGVDAVTLFLTAALALPVPCIVAQHMPVDLGADFCRYLAARTGRPVSLGEDGMVVQPGEVIVLPGGTDGHLLRKAGSRGLLLRLACGGSPVHPSVDALFASAAQVAGRALGVVLTGMGRDGEAGARAMVDRAMPVLAQTPESCVVAGMPRAVIDAGLAVEIGDPVMLGRRAASLTAPASVR